MLFSIVAAPFNIPTNSVGGKHMFDCHTWGWEKLLESLGWKLRMQLDILQCTAQPPQQSIILPKMSACHGGEPTPSIHDAVFFSIIYIIHFPFLLLFYYFLLLFYWDKILGKWQCSTKGYIMLIGSFRRHGTGVGDGKKVSGD